MSGLRSRTWQRFLWAPDPALLEQLYIPALQEGVRYDRCCAYFSSSVLAAAARGFGALIERLMELGEDAPRPAVRLLVNEEMQEADVRALTETGDVSAITDALKRKLVRPRDKLTRDRLAMLGWLAKSGLLEVKVGLMRGGPGILHAKFGIIHDPVGDAIVFGGSGNESRNGLTANYEELEISTSWTDPARLEHFQGQFERLWSNQHPSVGVWDLPDAVRLELIRYAPPEPPSEPVDADLARQRAAMVWQFIAEAPYLADPIGGAVCDATAPVDLWPHQRHVVEETAAAWPEGRLLCDEVGLGKTIEAILVLRHLLAGRGVQRVLLLLPAGLLRQWQAELREKGGISAPRLDNLTLVWPDERKQSVANLAEALKQDILLLSRETARLPLHSTTLLSATPWDLVILDEAHAARRADQEEGAYNSATLLLDLLRQLQLRRQARGLLLLSATPMQTQPWEPWDLLATLGEGGRWLAEFNAVRRYYGAIGTLRRQTCPPDLAEHVASLVVADPGFPALPDGVPASDAARVSQRLRFATQEQRPPLADWLRAGSPLTRRMHRNTRRTLEGYYQSGLLAERPARRLVDDQQFDYEDAAERGVYDAVKGYIDRRYDELESEKGGKGFVMTIYRRRASSSPYALRQSLLRRADGLRAVIRGAVYDSDLAGDDATDAWLLDDLGDEWTEGKVSAALPTDPQVARAELQEVERLLQRLDELGDHDSKRDRFYQSLNALLGDDRAILVFTEYADTMHYLRDSLLPHYQQALACYSGDGGQLWDGTTWQSVTKNVITRELRAGRIRILVCTDAASEGLNLQAASAVINYDLPWNPSRVEQRIGRVDRIGQRRTEVHVINLFLRDSVDDRVYRALRERCGLFIQFVGAMQPVLAEARRMLLGRESANPVALRQLADTVNATDAIREAWIESVAESGTTAQQPLSRSEMMAALALLAPETGIQVRNAGDGKVTVQGAGITRTTFATTIETLEADRTLEPLTPSSLRIREISTALSRPGERLPLVVATHAAGPFRAAELRWVAGDSSVSVDSLATLRSQIDAWDGTPVGPDALAHVTSEARATARRRVQQMAELAEARVQSGLARQVEAATYRLQRELARYLLVMNAVPNDLNARWYELMQPNSRDSSTATRLRTCLDRLGGYPVWESHIVADARDVARRLTESQRRARIAGSEIDAALNDPRWIAQS